MLKKLRKKFILINMMIVAAMLVVIFGLVYHFTSTNLERQSMDMVQLLAKEALHPEAPGERAPVTLPHFTLKVNFRGMVTATGVTSYDLNDEEFIQQMLEAAYSSKEVSGTVDGYDLLYYRTSFMDTQCIAYLDISSQRAALMALIQTSAVIGLVALCVFGYISFLLAKWAVKPVEKTWNQQKQFVSDASHELKTPLTVIMNNAELLQNEECDIESRRRFSESILTMSRQMRNLVESLLELARADSGQVQKTFEPIDLGVLVEESMLPFEPVFYERGLLLQSQVEQGITMMGSGPYLHQAVDILLDNALKYSAPGIVSVRLGRQGRSCLLTVDNPGEPIPQDEREKIFERFYRADQARSRTGSFGLGLSIARQVVEEHGGKIWAESNQTGNRFCIRLPLV